MRLILTSFAGISLLLLPSTSNPLIETCRAQQPTTQRQHSAQRQRSGFRADRTARPCWGIAGGLLFGIHSGVGKGDGEPRGLIRIYSPVLPGGKYDLINFIAIEPIVAGRRGFSEMELSRLDHVQGKRIWTAADSGTPVERVKMEPGTITRLASGVELLELALRVERFDNGARLSGYRAAERFSR